MAPRLQIHGAYRFGQVQRAGSDASCGRSGSIERKMNGVHVVDHVDARMALAAVCRAALSTKRRSKPYQLTVAYVSVAASASNVVR